MKARHIIWDFDGTLFDTYSTIVEAFANILEKQYNLSVSTDRIYELVKVDTKYCAQCLALENNLNQQELLVSAREAYNNISTKEQQPFEYVREVCNKIVSTGGSNFLVTHRDRKSLNKMLTKHDFHSTFIEIVSSDDGFPEKPSPESFNYLISKYNLPIDKTLGAGDRELDVLAANFSGISSVYFCPSGGTHHKAYKNISSFTDLYSLIT